MCVYIIHPLVVYKMPLSTFYCVVIKRCFCKRSLNNKQYFRCSTVLCKNVQFNIISKFDEKDFSSLCSHTNTKKRLINHFHTGPILNGQEASSKVEEAIKTMKEEKKERQSKSVDTLAVTKASEKAIARKQNLWQRIKAELLHYYHGFRLLYLDMKVSAKLIWRILQGYELNRREHRLLIKTTGDVFRLIPFSVFIIVPFMEFLLPIAIKFFPGLLPSTFQTANDKEDKLKQALKVKIEMAKFLQKTLDEMAVQSSNHQSEKAKEFAEFFYKVRTSGTLATNDEIMKFSKLFEDEITLDSLSRQQLIALCRVLDVQTLGTTNFIRFLLRMKLRSLAADDKLIEKEGVDTLTRAELQQACRARGMRAYGMPEHRLREQLSQWLDLSLTKKVPPSLLLLSRALMVPDTIPMSDKLKATISALPDSVVARTKGAIGEKEGKLDHETNIEIIKMEEKKIEEERQEEKEIKEKASEKSDGKLEHSVTSEITTTDVKVIEQALDSMGKDKRKMSIAKEELKELKEEMAEYQEDLQEFQQLKVEATGLSDIENIKVSKGANRLFKKVNNLISKLDTVLTELEQSEKKIKEEINSLQNEDKSQSKVAAELIRIDELIMAIKQIQNVPDNHRLSRITEILGKIDDDRDGAVKIEDVLKVVELIGKEDIKLNKKQLNELIELIEKEEILEVEEQIQKVLEKENSDTENMKTNDFNELAGYTGDSSFEKNNNSIKISNEKPDNDIGKTEKFKLDDNENSSSTSILKNSQTIQNTARPPKDSQSSKKVERSKQL